MLGGLWRWFNPTKVEAVPDLVGTLSAEALHIAQKVPLDFCAARVGIFTAQLYTEKPFLDAMEACRRASYLAVSGDLLIMIEGLLRGPAERDALADAIAKLYQPVIDKPKGLGLDPETRAKAVEHFAIRYALARQHAPRKPVELAVHSGQALYNSLPLHKRYTKDDHDAILATVQLRLTMTHDSLRKRLGRDALVRNLIAGT